MKNMTIHDVLEATGGRLLCGNENKLISDISTDSREMSEHTLFVPLLGEHVDAHNYIQTALQNGGATLTQEHSEMNDTNPWIYVKDTKQALQDIACYYRNRMTFPIVAVTGSVGKTTTREMITCALEAKYHVFHTEGNQNSQVGVPLTIARMTGTEDIAVLEAGISEFGEMKNLARMIQPDMVAVTNIGVSHIEQLKTRENICMEKLSIEQGMPDTGILFLNGDDDMLMKKKKELQHKVVTYGMGKKCDFRAENIRMEEGKVRFDCVCEEGVVSVALSVLGQHNVLNALVALAIASQYEVTLTDAAARLATFQGQRQRIHQKPLYTIIDDSYNASPDSMRASISVLSDMPASGRKIAVLADMLELGEKSHEYHYEVGCFLAEKKIDVLVYMGENAEYINRGVRDHNITTQLVPCNTTTEIIRHLKKTLCKGDVVLFKASNGMHLSEAVKEFI
ncbi:MAG: UDP-N-acetylmuramoyl-tripeptide--D-alanyl-D-alanine ligase [Lachnospiraceae bacterium]